MSLLPKRTGVHSPFAFFDEGFHSLMDDFFVPFRGDDQARRMAPRVDIKEKPTAFEVKADLPGIKKDDIELTLQGGVLTISATREDEHKEEKEGELLRQERTFGRYMRQIPLGNNIDEASVHASFENGVLEVTIPKLDKETVDKVTVDIK